MEDLFVVFFGLAGVGSLISIIVNILKVLNVVKDGQAQLYVTGLNLLGLIILFIARLFIPDLDIGEVDSLAAGLANVLAIVVAFVIQVGSSKITHIVLKNTPIIGKSFSG